MSGIPVFLFHFFQKCQRVFFCFNGADCCNKSRFLFGYFWLRRRLADDRRCDCRLYSRRRLLRIFNRCGLHRRNCALRFSRCWRGCLLRSRMLRLCAFRKGCPFRLPEHKFCLLRRIWRILCAANEHLCHPSKLFCLMIADRNDYKIACFQRNSSGQIGICRSILLELHIAELIIAFASRLFLCADRRSCKCTGRWLCAF